MFLDSEYAKRQLQNLVEAYSGKGCKDLNTLATATMPDINDPLFDRKYVAYNLVRKWDQLNTGIDTKAAALAAFFEAEDICFYTNRHAGTSNTTNRNKKRVGEQVVFHAVRKIGRLMSGCNLAELLAGCDHSGGASLQRPRRRSSIKNKWNDRNEITRAATGWWNLYRNDAPLIRGDVTFVNASRGDTVPKDAKTDRFITIEPQGMMLLQKGVGAAIRRRLLKVGINLNDQTINRTLCANYNNATIDMKSASDRISMSTVQLLLQQAPLLLDAVESLRTPFVTLSDRTLKLEKCSGMGNGFTFELESLIFYALAWASVYVTGGDQGSVSVYGDDIIIPVTASYVLKTALAYLGMTVNKQKSYDSGPFRESCGAHYWKGTDVTPMYIKSSTFETVGDWYHLCNELNELLGRVYNERAHNILRGLVKYLRKRRLLLPVPPRYGSRSGLRASFDVARPYCKPRSARSHQNREGFSFMVNGDVTKQYRVSKYGSYITELSKSRHQRDYWHTFYNVCHGPVRMAWVFNPTIDEYSRLLDPPLANQPGESMQIRETLQKRVIPLNQWDDGYFVFWV